MTTAQHVAPALPAPTGALMTLATEVVALLDALLGPRDVIAEVERWRALNVEADAIEATQPRRAAALRRQAAQIGV